MQELYDKVMELKARATLIKTESDFNKLKQDSMETALEYRKQFDIAQRVHNGLFQLYDLILTKRILQTDLLTVQEAAELCKVQQQTIRLWIKTGKIRANETSGKKILINPQELKNYINV